MIVQVPFPATLEDLMKVEGKAELIGGRIVHLMATGRLPSRVAFNIAVSLRRFAKSTGVGEAFGDNLGYALPGPLPNGRESFNPDASYYDGPPSADADEDMNFIPGAPRFAVEVRSKNDYGPLADRGIADKRADYFLAGTTVVWDVDPLARTITRHLQNRPPVTFRLGDQADAEPAVPGWRLSVDDALFNE